MITSEITTLATAVFVSGIGVAILWSNPRRGVNRVVSTCSIHTAAWLLCVYHARAVPYGSAEGFFWYRMGCAVGGSMALHFYFVKEVIAGQFRWSLKLGAWGGLTVFLTAICFSDWFVPGNSSPSHRIYGWGYAAYIAVTVALFGWLLLDAGRDVRRLSGAPRLELQLWLLGGVSMAMGIIGLMIANAATGDARYIPLQPLVVLVFFTFTAIATATHRVFDARHIILWAVGKLVTVAAVVAVAYLSEKFLVRILPHLAALSLTIGLSFVAATFVMRWVPRTLQLYPEMTAARYAVIDAARSASDWEHLLTSFRSVLEGWANTSRVIIVAAGYGDAGPNGVALSADDPVVETLRLMKWVTPERLSRERATPARVPVADFLAKHSLAAVVVSHGRKLTVLVGLGPQASRRPYTYPQITQLLELVSIMENAMERAHFSAQAQRAEQLATLGLLGASVAHEIQNPLVAIRTFVQLLPAQHENPAFREKFFRLIGDEVQRVDQLTKQLLDLASPRLYSAQAIALHPVVLSSLHLVEAKAAGKAVKIRTDLRALSDQVQTDPAAVKQVVLNLCFNAIQAMEQTPAEAREIRVATRNVGDQVELAISDTGPGIAPEILPRLFEHFQTTKSSGFGLGLAICRDILENLGAKIRVDPSVVDEGATFRVSFPASDSKFSGGGRA